MQKVLNVMVDQRQAVEPLPWKKGTRSTSLQHYHTPPTFSRRSGAWRNRGKWVPRTKLPGSAFISWKGRPSKEAVGEVAGSEAETSRQGGQTKAPTISW